MGRFLAVCGPLGSFGVIWGSLGPILGPPRRDGWVREDQKNKQKWKLEVNLRRILQKILGREFDAKHVRADIMDAALERELHSFEEKRDLD